MDYSTPNSTCQLCLSEYSGKGITRHIKSCLNKNLSRGDKNLFYIHVSDLYPRFRAQMKKMYIIKQLPELFLRLHIL